MAYTGSDIASAIPKQSATAHFGTKLEELSGFLNQCYSGMEELYKRVGLNYPETPKPTPSISTGKSENGLLSILDGGFERIRSTVLELRDRLNYLNQEL